MSRHLCHWPDCEVEVPPKLWGCRTHWYRLPKHLRDLIWSTYRPGQEIDKKPSVAYISAAMQVRAWIEDSLKAKPDYPCRFCNGNGWFHSDPAKGPCRCLRGFANCDFTGDTP